MGVGSYIVAQLLISIKNMRASSLGKNEEEMEPAQDHEVRAMMSLRKTSTTLYAELSVQTSALLRP